MVVLAALAAAELVGASNGRVCDVLADLAWPFCIAVTVAPARIVDGLSGDASESVTLLRTTRQYDRHFTFQITAQLITFYWHFKGLITHFTDVTEKTNVYAELSCYYSHSDST